MSTNTLVLGLFEYDPTTDANLPFSITDALNNNWDKIDSLVPLLSTIAAPFNPEQSYAVGAYCTYQGNLQRCNTNIPTGEVWNPSHWDAVTIMSQSVNSGQINQPNGVAGLDENGAVPVEQGGTGETTAQAALAALGAGVRPNLLDNAIFVGGGTGWGVFPVNQRGVSGTISTPGYFIDRWKLISGTVQITAAGLVLNGTIAQILPSSIGSVCTATALTTTGIVTCQYDDASRTFTITGTGQTFIFAKLEKGLGQTAAYQDADGTWNLLPQPDINYATQLLRCQQYFFACKDVLENFLAIMNGLAGYATIQTPVPMAKTPVFVKDGSSGYGVVYTSAGATGITNVSVHSSIGNHVTLTIATVSEIVANCVWRECAFALDTGM